MAGGCIAFRMAPPASSPVSGLVEPMESLLAEANGTAEER